MDNLGATDFFGLDERGRPDGNAMLGAVVGTGLGSVTAIGVRRYGGVKYGKYAELFGMGASVAAGAVLYFTGQKSSGMTAAIAGLLNNGLRALEQQMFAPAGSKLFDGMVFTPTQALEGGRQMGMIDIEPTQALSGPVADYSQMPQLVGASLQSAADHIQLVGGPQLSQHSGAWGATVMGGGH